MKFLHSNCILLHSTDYCTRSIYYQSIWSQVILDTHRDVYIYLNLRSEKGCTKLFHLLCLETLRFQQMAKQLLLLNDKRIRDLFVNTVWKPIWKYMNYNFRNYIPAFGASKTLIAVTSRLPEYFGLPILESPLGSLLRSMCDIYSPPMP